MHLGLREAFQLQNKTQGIEALCVLIELEREFKVSSESEKVTPVQPLTLEFVRETTQTEGQNNTLTRERVKLMTLNTTF